MKWKSKIFETMVIGGFVVTIIYVVLMMVCPELNRKELTIISGFWTGLIVGIYHWFRRKHITRYQ